MATVDLLAPAACFEYSLGMSQHGGQAAKAGRTASWRRIAMGLLCSWAGVVAAATASPAAAAEPQRLLCYMADGSLAGEQVQSRSPDGWINVRFAYKDNGRGPDLQERLKVAADGTLAEFHVSGSETMGARVDEHFSRQGERAEWRSTSDQGSAQPQGSAMYVPINSSFEVSQLMALKLAQLGPQAKLALLPSGQLSQRVLAELTLSRPAGASGPAQRRVQLVAQSGLGWSPTFLWLGQDQRGRAKELFAFVEPGYFAWVQPGWKDAIGTLSKRQIQAEGELQKEQAQQLQTPLTGLTAVRNARVFDSETAQLGAPSDVFVLRGRITAVTPAGSIAARADREIDAAGRVLLPGLYDMHGHLSSWEGMLHLAAGVTTVRDMGNDNRTLQRHMDDIAAGRLLGPQVVPAGFLEGESPYSARNGFVISTREQAELAVDWYVSHGYPQLKIYNSFPKELLPGIVAYAHGRGMRVSGHVPVHLRAAEAVDAGYDEIQHINQLLLNFLVKPDTDTRTLDRFYLPARELANLDLDSAPVQAFIRQLVQQRVAVDPTLGTFDFIQHRPGQIATPMAAVASHLPPDVQRGLRTGGLDIPDEATAQRFAASYAKMLEFVGRLYRAGVPVLAGTDDTAGFTLHSELALYVQAGLTPAQALQVATRNGAIYTRTQADRGRIAPGLAADMLLVDGDPTRDINELRKVALVITQGQLIQPAKVYQAMGITPFTEWAPALK